MRLLDRVVEWTIAKESLELPFLAVLLVHVLFVPFIKFEYFVGVDRPVQVHRVIMFG